MDFGTDDITVSLTPGKITLWFGRRAGESLIRDIVFGISSIDSSITHEEEMICDFTKIAEYESMGYLLTSYAKTNGGYKAIFNIPFSKKIALSNFVRTIVNQLRDTDVKKILHWNGSQDKMKLIYNKLNKLDGWDIKDIERKVKGNLC